MASEKALRKRAEDVIGILSREYSIHGTKLRWKRPWELLVAVMLSAQTTDDNVNRVTPALFKAYPTPKAVAGAPREAIERLVYSTGYYKSKAKNLQACAKAVVDEHDGRVPETMSELVALPGVGRKTANVVLQVWKGARHGIVMDTHIQRVTMRLGFIEKKDAIVGERTMMRLLPKEYWLEWGDLLIQHGRAVCHARKPECEKCALSKICPSAFNVPNR